MTNKELRKGFADHPVSVASALAEDLKDYGYEVETHYVEREMRRLINGGAPRVGVSMLLAGALTANEKATAQAQKVK